MNVPVGHSFLLLLIPVAFISAQDTVNENALFSDTVMITKHDSAIGSAAIDSGTGNKSVGFSGTITSAVIGTMLRGFFDSLAVTDTRFNSFITGDFDLDIRLTEGFKAYGSSEVRYLPVAGHSFTSIDTSTTFYIPELFLDANVGNKVYFRTGKQVLQWGRCYLWTPTDLINIEKKTFVQKVGLREGTYGIKLHVPFGATYNIYGFLGMYNVTRPDSLYGAVKTEALFGGTEMALSVWGKHGYKPVYGFDISSTVFDFILNGELGLYQGYPLKKIAFDKGTEPFIETVEQPWIPRASVNINRFFDVLDVKDRLSICTEFYYNQVGNTDSDIQIPLPPALVAGGLVSDSIRQHMLGVLTANGLYEANSFSRYYLAIFCSFGRFIYSDLALNLNGIVNFNQECATVSAALTYINLSNFNMGVTVIGFVGKENTEYTISKNIMQFQVSAGVTF